MFQAHGLYGHTQANRLRSGLLLVGFVALLHALLFSLPLIWSALLGGTLDAIPAGMRRFARSLAARDGGGARLVRRRLFRASAPDQLRYGRQRHQARRSAQALYPAGVAAH